MDAFNKNCFDGYLTAGCKHCCDWADGSDPNRGIGCACHFPIMECNHFSNFYNISEMERDENESSYDFVMRKLSKRIKGTPMYLEEANWLLGKSTISIYQDFRTMPKVTYMWFGIMSQDEGYNTPRGALNAALRYMKNGGY